jgi:hypothetical protein
MMYILATAAGLLRPIGNRPQLTKLPHKEGHRLESVVVQRVTYA